MEVQIAVPENADEAAVVHTPREANAARDGVERRARDATDAGAHGATAAGRRRRGIPTRRWVAIAVAAAFAGMAVVLVLRPRGASAQRGAHEAVRRLQSRDVAGASRVAELVFRAHPASADAAALAALARAASGDLPGALARIETAAHRDPAAAEPALEAGLLARALSRAARNGEELRARAARWFDAATERADAAAAAQPGAFGPRAVGAAARIAAHDIAGAMERIDALRPATPAEDEERDLLRAAALAARGSFAEATSGLRSRATGSGSARVDEAVARIETWRAASEAPPRVRGLGAWVAGDLEHASDALARAADERADDPPVLAALASSLARLGRTGDATRRRDALSAASPEGPAAPYFWGCHELVAERFDSAAASLAVAAARAPGDVAVLRALVEAQAAAAQGDSAARACAAASAFPGARSAACALRGAVHEAAGDDGAAEAAYREAVRAGAGRVGAADVVAADVGAVDRLADLLVRTGRAEEAETVLRAALGAAPTSVCLRVRLALTSLALGRAAAAEDSLRAVVRDAPACAPAQALLGRVLAARGAAGEARRAFSAALRSDPDCVEAHLGRIGLARDARALAAHAAALDEDLADAPRSAMHLFARGATAELLGDIDAAESFYRRALTVRPRLGVAANNLAWLLVERRLQPRDAAPFADDAVRLLPRSPQALDTRGWVRYRLGDFAAAERDLARAAAGLPRDGAVALRHARSLVALGRADEARRALDLACRATPTIREEAAFRSAASRSGWKESP